MQDHNNEKPEKRSNENLNIKHYNITLCRRLYQQKFLERFAGGITLADNI